MKKDLTEGSVLKSIIVLAIPIIFANLLQTAYNITDTFWVGRLGAEAVAAVSLSFPVIFLVITFAGGVGMSGAIFVSQYKGSKDTEKVNHVAGQTLMMAIVLSVIFSILGFIISPWIVKSLGADITYFNDAVSFMKISFFGLTFVFGYMVYQSLARGVGDAKTPFYIVLFTVLLNLVLDPLFIFGYGPIPASGVSGAAWATLVTQGLALIIAAIILFRGNSGIRLTLMNMRPDKILMKRIVKLGLPTSFEQVSRPLGFLILTAISASFGTVALATYGIGMRLYSLVIIPALSLAIVNSALVGQNYGAGKKERAEKVIKYSLVLGFLLLSVIGGLFFIFAASIVRVFIPNDPLVILEGARFMKIIAFTFGFVGINMTFIGAFRGAGDTKVNMKLSFMILVFQSVLAFIFAKYVFFSVIGIWYALLVSNLFGTFVTYIVYKRGHWRTKKVI